MSLGERIKQIRQSLGWTQDKLAHEAGISKSFLSEIENNKAKVSGDNLLKIANALNASLDYLMIGAKGPGEPGPKHIEIPLDFSDASEELGLSHSKTLSLLSAHQALVAKRSSGEEPLMTKEKWKEFYHRVKEYLE